MNQRHDPAAHLPAIPQRPTLWPADTGWRMVVGARVIRNEQTAEGLIPWRVEPIYASPVAGHPGEPR